MRRIWTFVFSTVTIAAAIGLRLAGQSTPEAGEPRFLAHNELERPDNYREWVWLSSGLGMTYGPLAPSAGK